MNAQLNVGERMIILSVLPKEGSIITIKLIRDLISRLGLSAEEFVEFGIKQDGSSLKFNEKGQKRLDFELHDAEIELIRKSLKELDSKGKLIAEMIPIWDMFC
jgi:hypothetical protein